MARRKRISAQKWETYKAIVNDFIEEDAGKQPVLWLKRFNQMLSFGEDSGENYEPIPLEGLIQYNYIRTWPSLKETVSGELDGINIVLYVTKRSLSEAGYLNEYGYWNFNWTQDKFVINGKVYSPSGDTQVAQALDEAILFIVVLKREPPEDSQRVLESLPNIGKYIELSKSTSELNQDNGRKDTVGIDTNSKVITVIVKKE